MNDHVPSSDCARDAGTGAEPGPRTLTIVNRRGLHARASAKFVQTAEAFDAELTIGRDGLCVGGQSIMGLMMLAAAQGTTIEVSAAGPQAKEALDAIEALVRGGFGEEC
ncbi:HPr family phosphocarrier protein [Aureimonas mangrovi]|uniref:HPr family phosphocarrier protein n=1 Tax=Aureimonas mangrovi TaxID=2758041 RepID=UPI00163DDABE|nr:HPr family phosphocarrier protein [Aureimonas mangrovi]